MSSNLPILALDIGLKRTGVAISESGISATPLETIQWQAHPDQLIRAVSTIVEDYQVKTLVIGLPNNDDDSETAQAGKTQALIEKIVAAIPVGIEVVIVNEFASTEEGREKYPDFDKDAAAAMVILERYLEDKL